MRSSSNPRAWQNLIVVPRWALLCNQYVSKDCLLFACWSCFALSVCVPVLFARKLYSSLVFRSRVTNGCFSLRLQRLLISRVTYCQQKLRELGTLNRSLNRRIWAWFVRFGCLLNQSVHLQILIGFTSVREQVVTWTLGYWLISCYLLRPLVNGGIRGESNHVLFSTITDTGVLGFWGDRKSVV